MSNTVFPAIGEAGEFLKPSKKRLRKHSDARVEQLKRKGSLSAAEKNLKMIHDLARQNSERKMLEEEAQRKRQKLKEKLRRQVSEKIQNRPSMAFLSKTRAQQAREEKIAASKAAPKEDIEPIDPEEAQRLRLFFRQQQEYFLKKLEEKREAQKRIERKKEAQERKLHDLIKKKALSGKEIQSRVFDPVVPAELLEPEPDFGAGSALNAVRAKSKGEILPAEPVGPRIDPKIMVQRQLEHCAKLLERRKQEKQAELRKKEEERRVMERLRLNIVGSLERDGNVFDRLFHAKEAPKEEEEESSAPRHDATSKHSQATSISRLSRPTFETVEVDEARWRKKNNIDSSSRLFWISPSYPAIRRVLEDRGWVYVDNKETPFFDLKWTMKAKEIHRKQLQEHQMVNHYFKASHITTKLGIMHSLRGIGDFEPVDVHGFFPRCYDLSDEDDRGEYYDDFACVAAVICLSRVVHAVCTGCTKKQCPPYCCGDGTAAFDITMHTPAAQKVAEYLGLKCATVACNEARLDTEGQSKRNKSPWLFDLPDPSCVPCAPPPEELVPPTVEGSEHVMVNPAVVNAALAVVFKRFKWLFCEDELLDVFVNRTKRSTSEPILEYLLWLERGNCRGSPLKPWVRRPSAISPCMTLVEEILVLGGKCDVFSPSPPAATLFNDYIGGMVSKPDSPPPEVAAVRGTPALFGSADLRPVGDDLLCKILTALRKVRSVPAFQPVTNSWPVPRNAWILKPAGKSRGRGIRCINSIDEVLGVKSCKEKKESLFVVQKYLERCLLIHNRKFDIRQWVIVTDWNPLTVFFFDDCYLRFCTESFSLDTLSDRFAHLANNCVQKHSKRFHETEIEGNMWHSDSFAAYLTEKYVRQQRGRRVTSGSQGGDIWRSFLQPMLKKLTVWSLQSAQQSVSHRRSSFELFGYDFMVDEHFVPWLIEINSSPDFSYSTPVTKRLVKDGSNDIAKVIVDFKDFELRYARRMKGGISCGRPKGAPDTGKWSLCYRGPTESLGRVPASDLQVRGETVSIPASRRRAPSSRHLRVMSLGATL